MAVGDASGVSLGTDAERFERPERSERLVSSRPHRLPGRPRCGSRATRRLPQRDFSAWRWWRACEASLRERGEWFYRRLFWECGLIGQVLYLEAEAAGARATGIGCFYDDPVHELLG